MKALTLVLLLALPLAAETSPTPPKGDGQLTEPATTFADPNPPPSDPARHFIGQQTPSGKLVLTASNGFFDRPIRATGESTVKDAAPDALIAPDFAYLSDFRSVGATARWHIWIENPGILHANLHLITATPGSRFHLSIDRSSHDLTTRLEKDPNVAQTPPLSFTIPNPGWHTLLVRLDSLTGEQAGQLHRLELFGPAAENASVLRTRWRPAACHARFSSSKVAAPLLWVMSTRPSPLAAVSSYSPVTTPFGYFGCSYNPDGTASGSANFSVWSFARGKSKPQGEWSHMLAVGSPEATFGSFGHEGSGVKLRGDWQPFAGLREVTLALRCEPAPPWNRWFGYYLDPTTHRFKLFAAAANWRGTSRKMPNLNPGAFVEQPGPPDRERSGDLLRDIQRRGWFLDGENQWHPVDTMSTGKTTIIASKHWSSTPDGWFAMGMGGISQRPGPGESVTLEHASPKLPTWLNDQAIKDLQSLPAIIGKSTITERTPSSAKIHIPISELNLAPGETATLTLFHGPEDSLTFDRDLGYSGAKTRFWPHHSTVENVTEGETTISLTDLDPSEKTYFRILIESPRGKIWSFETESIEPSSPGVN